LDCGLVNGHLDDDAQHEVGLLGPIAQVIEDIAPGLFRVVGTNALRVAKIAMTSLVKRWIFS